YRTFQQEGIPIALGTDNVPISLFFPLWNTVARETRTGEVVGPGQRMTLVQALPLVTREAAKLSFSEERKGVLRPGMMADFVVLERDLLSTPLDAIKDIVPRATVVGGRIVHAV